jgi:hypothetical protein
MTLDARDFSVTGQWAKAASTTIPPIPVSGQAYRRSTMTREQAEAGTPYDIVWESASNNQKDFESTGMAMEIETYGWPRWSPLTKKYVGGASFALGTDGIPYHAVQDSGIETSVGSVDPTTDTEHAYWELARDFFGGGLPQPYGENGSVLTVIDKDADQLGWVNPALIPKAGFSAYKNNGDQACSPNSVVNVITFTTVKYDAFGNAYNANASSFAPGKAGKYLINTCVLVASDAGAENNITLGVYVNGFPETRVTYSIVGSYQSGGTDIVNLVAIIDLDKDADVLDVRMYNVNPAVFYLRSGPGTYFRGALL